MRGEYVRDYWNKIRIMELPPRARRILAKGLVDAVLKGTTSACAENTIFLTLVNTKIRNYLRVRGEYMVETIADNQGEELPPRARRIQPAVYSAPG